MRTSKVISLSLPPGMYEHFKEIASAEGRTYSELFREALRQYIDRLEWRQLLKYGRHQAQQAGLTEADLERLVDEYRADEQCSK